MFLRSKPKRHILVLNVVALIDICSIIIIFLIMGTYFGETSIESPDGLRFPVSMNNDSVLQAPQVLIFGEKVKSNFVSDVVELGELRARAVGSKSSLQAYQDHIAGYLNNLPTDQKQSGVLLNVIADRSTPYRDVYDVLEFFREVGFQTVLFVAEGAR